MTVQLTAAGWLPPFIQNRSPVYGLQRFFTAKPGSVYNGDKVVVDVKRIGEKIATGITRASGPNLNDISQFTTKEFTPPSYGEAFPLDVGDLINRMIGVDPYSDAYTDYAAKFVSIMQMGFVEIDAMIMRAYELQAAQILQTGTVTIKNREGSEVFTLDFQPKATHFPDVGTSWATATGAEMLADIASLAQVIRKDGKVNPNMVILGRRAITRLLATADVRELLDVRNINVGEIRPELDDSGMIAYGLLNIEGRYYELWSYDESYEDTATGDNIDYLDQDKVIVISDRTRLDRASCRVPLPLGPDPRVASLMPGRMVDRANGIDVTPNVYCTPNGKQIMGELESRTLFIPVQIDGFGCLNTNPA